MDDHPSLLPGGAPSRRPLHPHVEVVDEVALGKGVSQDPVTIPITNKSQKALLVFLSVPPFESVKPVLEAGAGDLIAGIRFLALGEVVVNVISREDVVGLQDVLIRVDGLVAGLVLCAVPSMSWS